MNNTQNGSANLQNDYSIKENGKRLKDISEKILMNHLASFQKNDLDGIMSDYTDQSIFITPTATYTGFSEIKAFFAEFLTHFPKGQSTVLLDKTVIEDELIYIIWHAKTPTLEVKLASDTILIKHGKIWRQTFIGELNEIN